MQIVIIKICPKNIHCLSALTFQGGLSGEGGLGGLKNKLAANNNNGERSTRAAKNKKNKNKTKKKLPSLIFLAIGMLQSGREIVSLSSSSFPSLSRVFFSGGLFFFFFFSLCKKRRKSCTILSFAVYLPGEKLSPPQPGGERETDSGNHSCR